MDVSRFMVDIPLNDLLSGNFEVPSFYLKDNHDAKAEPEDVFEQQIESVLQLLPKRSVNDHPLKTSEGSGGLSSKGSKNTKVMLDLEHPLRPEEDDVPKMGKTDKQMRSDSTLEVRLFATSRSRDGFHCEIPSKTVKKVRPLSSL